jgi:hypothetical protein
MDSDTNGAGANTDVAVPAVSPLARIPDAQVFARDPEDYTVESTADTIERLRKIVARQRKARDDEAQVKEAAAKLKKTNTAAARKKSKLAADPLETIV